MNLADAHGLRPTTQLRIRDNHTFLRDDVIPWMLANPDRVNLNETNSPCGTFACLGGWYFMRRYGVTWRAAGESHGDEFVDVITHEFGERIENNLVCPLFGTVQFAGTIEDRAGRLAGYIASIDADIERWYAAREVTA